jgi:replicative DNA helicase
MPRDDTGASGPTPLRDSAPEGDIAEPASVELEQSFLGSLLVQNRQYERIVEEVSPGDFWLPLHTRIFRAIGTLIERGDQANPVTLGKLFDQDGVLAEIGGLRYLVKLAESTVTLINGPQYAQQIRELALRRRIIAAGVDMIADARRIQLERPVATIIEDFDRRILELHNGGGQNAPKPISTAIDAALASADRTYKADGRTTGVTTGLTDLDRKLGGLQPSDLVIIAGCTSMGKTALATGIGHSAARAGHDVLMFELEMSAEQLAQRLLAARTGISAERQLTGPLSAPDMRLPFTIDDGGGASVARVRGRALHHKRRHGLGLVIVDYLQLLQSDRTRPENRVQEVSSITLGLKAMAKELGVSVLALSQLSRGVEQREDKRPRLPDLRDSGSIEQDSDVVIFVYREDYYLTRDEPRNLRKRRTPRFSSGSQTGARG